MKEPPETKLTPEIELLVQKTVESRLEKLPATTHTLIEKMVHDRVAIVERFYRITGGIIIGAITLVAIAFFKITADNASEKASAAIVKSDLGKKLKEVDDAHAQIQNTKNQVALVGPEALENATKITAKLRELESQDNIVRLSSSGNLILNLQDGDIRLRRKNPDKEIVMLVDKEGHLQISDGTTWLDVLHANYLMSAGGTTKVNK